MPTGKVRFYDEEKGFGFITSDDGQDVFLHATALPAGTTAPKAGTRLEFGVADGKRGLQALSVRVLEAPPSLAKAQAQARRRHGDHRRRPREAARRHRRRPPPRPVPERRAREKVAAVLRKVADDFDA